MRDSQTGYELLIDAGHAEWCFSSRNIQCNLHIEGRIAFLSLRHPLRQGAVLSLFIHDDWVAHDATDHDTPHAATDETSLLDLSKHMKHHGIFSISGLGLEVGGLEENSASGAPDPPNCRIESGKVTGSLEDNSALGTPSGLPPSATWKPNPNLVEEFDAVIPFRHRTTDGHIAFGRTIPPPNWERNHFLRSAAGSGAAYHDDDGELRVLVRSWIASTHSTLILPHRDVTIRGQLMSAHARARNKDSQSMA